MKMFKKVMSIVLAAVLISVSFIAPVSAADAVPLIVVNDLGWTPLVSDKDTSAEKQLFPLTDADTKEFTTKLVAAVAAGFTAYGVLYDNWQVFCSFVLPVFSSYIDPIAYNPDGTPKYDNAEDKSPNCSMSNYPVDAVEKEDIKAQKEEREKIFSVFGVEYGEKFGDENVYAFGYDWRRSPIDCADDLDAYIEQVKSETGADKVNVVAVGQGSNVMLAYMNAYGGTSINNLVFASPAWQGTSIMGSLFTGDIELDIFAVENYLVMLANGSFTTHFAAYITSFIASYEGLSHEYFGKFNYILQKMLPRIYSDIIDPQVKGMPGLWSLVPVDYYDNAKDFMYPDSSVDPDFEAKIDAYNAMQKNAKSIIESCEEDGMKFGIVCGYNGQLFPVNETYPTSDTLIDTKYASGGAVCAKYLQAFDDWGAVHKQEIKDEHNHISWDQRIDSSTCMFPEQTWFIKNLQHSAYNTQNGTTELVMWLLTSDKQQTVTSDLENHSQFSLFNTYTRQTKNSSPDLLLGDVNMSTAVTIADARLALKISADLVEPTEDQIFVGDIDEDGIISADDARSILCMAVDIPY